MEKRRSKPMPDYILVDIELSDDSFEEEEENTSPIELEDQIDNAKQNGVVEHLEKVSNEVMNVDQDATQLVRNGQNNNEVVVNKPTFGDYGLKPGWTLDDDDDNDHDDYCAVKSKKCWRNLYNNWDDIGKEAAQIAEQYRHLKIGVECSAIDLDQRLITEKYKPKGILDLVTANNAHMLLHHWILIWDKFVFGDDYLAKIYATYERHRRTPNPLLDCYDKTGRPALKVALLAGPPGVGKTVSAHTVAKQAGYRVIEVNASDERSVAAIKRFVVSTQMRSHLLFSKDNARPQCLILDEMDGMTKEAIALLLKAIQENKKGGDILSRPVICICNDLYSKNLAELRKFVHIIKFEPVSLKSLGDRLDDILEMEHIELDVFEKQQLLAESDGDIRACLVALDYYRTVKKNGLVSKFCETRRLPNIFDTCNQIYTRRDHMTEVEKTVHDYGNYSRLSQVLFDNYLSQMGNNQASLDSIVQMTRWFNWHEELHGFMSQKHDYSLYCYLPFAFIGIHKRIAKYSPRRNNINLTKERPSVDGALLQFYKELPPKISRFLHRDDLTVDVLSNLAKIVQPNTITDASWMTAFCQKADDKLIASHAVDVMIDFNLQFTANKETGYQLQPAFAQALLTEEDKLRLAKKTILYQELIRLVHHEHIKRNDCIDEIVVKQVATQGNKIKGRRNNVKRLLPEPGVNMFAPKKKTEVTKRKLLQLSDPSDDPILQLYSKNPTPSALNTAPPAKISKPERPTKKQPTMKDFFPTSTSLLLFSEKTIDQVLASYKSNKAETSTADVELVSEVENRHSLQVVTQADTDTIFRHVSELILESGNKNKLCRLIASKLTLRKIPVTSEAIRKRLERLPEADKIAKCTKYNISKDKFMTFFHKQG